MRWMMIAAALVAVTSLCAVRAHAGPFKLDFGTLQNTSAPLTNWDTFPDWSFMDFPGGLATWQLTDYSTDNNTNVTLTITDNAPLSVQLGAPAIGMGGNNPDPQGLAVVYDGKNEPAAQNTGGFSANPLSNPNDPNLPRVPNPRGHPQTLVVNIKAMRSINDFLAV